MSALIRGELMHARRDELARRTFRYPVMMAAIELDELAALDRRLRLFSHNRPNLFALYDRDYERGAIGDLLVANGVPAPARTRLITNLRTCGYAFNPVSFFLGYDAAGALSSVVAEVNNTYGGRRRYVLGPGQRIDRGGPRVGFRTVRELYVSPFLHGECDYEWWFDAPVDGERLAITMHVDRRDGAGGRDAGADADDRDAGRRTVDVRGDRDGDVDRDRGRGGDRGGDGDGDGGRDRDRDGDRGGDRVRESGGGGRRGDRIFVAQLTGKCEALTDRALIAAALRYPLMSAQVIALIHFEAMRLRLRGVPFLGPPADHRPHPRPAR